MFSLVIYYRILSSFPFLSLSLTLSVSLFLSLVLFHSLCFLCVTHSSILHWVWLCTLLARCMSFPWGSRVSKADETREKTNWKLPPPARGLTPTPPPLCATWQLMYKYEYECECEYLWILALFVECVHIVGIFNNNKIVVSSYLLL